MKILLYLSLLMFSDISIFAQPESSKLKLKLCDYETDGTGNSNNLKIKLSIPCNWEKTSSNQGNVVVNYDYKSTGLVRMSLTITKMPKEVSEAYYNFLKIALY